MSLRGFHIVFVSVTTLLCVFLTLWAFLWAPASMGSSATILGIIGVCGAIVLPIYGVCFYRKAKKLIL